MSDGKKKKKFENLGEKKLLEMHQYCFPPSRVYVN